MIKKSASTFAAFAQGEADQPRGRFNAIDKPRVTGASPVPQYPAQPPGSPWASEQPTEPPLGFSVEQMDPVGEPFEVERSLRERSGDVVSSSQVVDGASPSGGSQSSGAVQPPGAVVETRPPPLKKRSKR